MKFFLLTIMLSLPAFSYAEAQFNEDAKDLVKCLRKTAQKKDFAEKRDAVTSFVNSLYTKDKVWTTDKYSLFEAKHLCERGDFKKIFIPNQADALIVKVKSEKFLEGLAKPVYKCRGFSGKVLAGKGIALGAGMIALECQSSDGSVRRYAGPKALFGVGVGGVISVTEEDSESTYMMCSDLGAIGLSKVGVLVGGLGKVYSVDSLFWGEQPNNKEYGAGLMVTLSADVSAQVRLPNAPYNWDYIFKEVGVSKE